MYGREPGMGGCCVAGLQFPGSDHLVGAHAQLRSGGADVGEDVADEFFRDQHVKAARAGDQLVSGRGLVRLKEVGFNVGMPGCDLREDLAKEGMAAQHVVLFHACDAADAVGRFTSAHRGQLEGLADYPLRDRADVGEGTQPPAQDTAQHTGVRAVRAADIRQSRRAREGGMVYGPNVFRRRRNR